MRRLLVVLASIGVLAFLCSTANAVTIPITFHAISSNGSYADVGEEQLLVEITDYAEGQALFTFKNIGLEDCTITEIYFDDGALLGIAQIIDNAPDVSFVQGATPEDMPSGGDIFPVFITTQNFSADATNPAPKRGVNPYEQVGILFDLKPGYEFKDVPDQLRTGELRIGVHVSSFTDGTSESFVNNVPEPLTILLLGLGAIGLRKKK